MVKCCTGNAEVHSLKCPSPNLPNKFKPTAQTLHLVRMSLAQSKPKSHESTKVKVKEPYKWKAKVNQVNHRLVNHWNNYLQSSYTTTSSLPCGVGGGHAGEGGGASLPRQPPQQPPHSHLPIPWQPHLATPSVLASLHKFHVRNTMKSFLFVRHLISCILWVRQSTNLRSQWNVDYA